MSFVKAINGYIYNLSYRNYVNNENCISMKKLVLALSLVSSAVMAQDYKPMWREYEKYEKDNRPASAVEVLDRIYNKAFENRDFSVMLKSYLLKSGMEENIAGADHAEFEIKRLETIMEMDFSDDEKAILASLLFLYYSDYYRRNELRFERLTSAVTDVLPESLDDWSRENVLDRMMFHLVYVKEKIPSLVAATTGDYEHLFEQNRLGSYLGHNVASVILKLISDEIGSLVLLLENHYPQKTPDFFILCGNSFLSRKINPAGKYDFTAVLASLYAAVEKCFLENGMSDAYVITEADRIELFRTMTGMYDISPRFFPGEGNESAISVADSAAMTAYDRLIKDYVKNRNVIPYAVYRKSMVMKSYQALHGETVEMLRAYIKKFSSGPWNCALKSIEADLTNPYLSASMEMPCVGDSFGIKIESRNLESCRIRIYHAKEGREYAETEGDYEKFLRENAVFYSSCDYRLSKHNEWDISQDTVMLEGLPQGRWYIYLTSTDKKVSQAALIPADITEYTFVTSIVNGCRELLILDRKSGRPKPGVNVGLSDKYVFENADTTMVTDSRGVVHVPEGYNSAEVYNDGCYRTRFSYIYFNDIAERDVTPFTYKLFTDRSVYRPGQKIRVSGFVAKSENGRSYSAVPGKDVTISIRGSYGLNLELEQKEKTDDFGTFAAEFQLPQHCANGVYFIEAGGERHSVRIEEYKRPAFEVKLEKPEDNFRLGDKVFVKGNASLLAGVAVQDADVKYKVERGVSRWTNWRFGNYTVIDEGTVRTDSKGDFSIPLLLESVMNPYFDGFCSFRVTAYVTSQSGETQEDVITVFAGDRSFILKCYVPDIIWRDNGLKFTPAVTNLENIPAETEGYYSLLDAGSRKVIFRDKFLSNNEIIISPERLLSGKFILRLEIDDRGRTLTEEKEIVLFSDKDKTVPVRSHLWSYQLNREISEDCYAEFMLGTSSDEAYVIMFISDGKRTVERRDMILKNGMKKISIPLPDKNSRGLGVTVVSYCNGKYYKQAFTYRVRKPEHKLSMKWNVFRDRLKPGQDEEWRMTLLNPDGTPAIANVAAFMYDSSLDMIYSNPVDFLLEYSGIVSLTPLYTERRGWYGGNVFFQNEICNYEFPEPDRFRDFMLRSRYGSLFNYGRGVRPLLSKSYMSANGAVMNIKDDCAVLEESVVASAAPAASVKTQTNQHIRENFAETAFFYPRLRTDEKGEVSIMFKLPESMTGWHFHALAHTGNMYQMQTDTMVVASKELMVMPEMPRFVRAGDDVSIAASVVNCTENSISGKVIFELFEPINGKIFTKKETFFEAGGDETVKVKFEFETDDRYTALGVRVIAETPTFSDGEQNIVQVLPDRTHLTESIHFMVNGGETEKYNLESLFNDMDKSASDRRLIIDVTTSPVWYAVEVLPFMSDLSSDDAVTAVSSLYANLMAQHILETDRELQKLVKKWVEAAAKSDAPLSMLERNPDLKNIILSETPWMLEAKSETERIKRLAGLFDRNNMNYLSGRFAGKIAALQNNDGSISWYAGGKGNYFMTLFVAEKLLAMKSAGLKLPADVNIILEKSVGYINKFFSDEYKLLLDKGNNVLDTRFIDFAYLKAMYGMELTANGKFVYDYVIGKLPEMLNSLSLVSQAKAIVILKDAGNMVEAERFFVSLQEYGTETSEDGLYFPVQTNRYGWGEYPVNAHVVIMQAYKTMNAGREKIDALRTWLIQQKRTQDWGNPVATVDAVSELLESGTYRITDNGDFEIRIGRTEVDINQDGPSSLNIPGNGRKIYEGKDIPEKLSSMTVSRSGEAPVWGVVYAQYSIPYSEIKDSNCGMKISKQVFIRRMVDGRDVLYDPAEIEVKTGDEYVSRIKFILDRDMDFVHIRDRRAACAEPGISLSGYRDCGDVWAYVQERDSSTDYFFDSLQKGEYTIQAVYRIDRTGQYMTGNAEVQCMYAPEFNAHSASGKITVTE